MQERADNGDSEAQLRMAVFHVQGQYKKYDIAMAARYLYKAAKNNHVRAAFMIHGNSIFQSEGLPDINHADLSEEPYFTYFFDGPTSGLLDRGYLPAIKTVWMDEAGLNEKPELIASIERASEQGDAEAMAFLTGCHLTGFGTVRIDYEKAKAAFARLLDTGDYQAINIMLNVLKAKNNLEAVHDFLDIPASHELEFFLKGILYEHIEHNPLKAAYSYLSLPQYSFARYFAGNILEDISRDCISAGVSSPLFILGSSLKKKALLYHIEHALLFKIDTMLDMGVHFDNVFAKGHTALYTYMLVLVVKKNFYQLSVSVNGDSINFMSIITKIQNQKRYTPLFLVPVTSTIEDS